MEFPAAAQWTIPTRIGGLKVDVSPDGAFVSDRPPAQQSQHNHAMHELHFIESGRGVLMLGERQEPLVPFTAYWIPPGVYHAFHSDPAEPLRKYTCRLDGSEPQAFAEGLPEETQAFKSLLQARELRRFPAQEALLPLYRGIARELRERQLGYYSLVQAGFSGILIELLRAGAGSRAASAPIPPAVPDEDRSHRIDAYFDQYAANLTLEHLAGLLHLSTRQTNRVLQQMYGKTFSEKLADTRIEAAREQLVHTRLPIAHIAERLGFASPSFFARAFKARTGSTPQAYRKTNAAGERGNPPAERR